MRVIVWLVSLQAALVVATRPIVTLAMLESVFKPCGVEDPKAKGQNISCARALRHINRALRWYRLRTPAQVAFYLATVAVESGNLSLNRARGSRSQGTRAMLTAVNLHAFLKDSPAIRRGNRKLRRLAAKPYKDAKAKVLKVLMKDKYSFLPGAWWIRRGGEKMHPKCKRFARTLQGSVSRTSFDELLVTCVGATVSQARWQKFQTALHAIQGGSIRVSRT